jgi:hypothetical protein
MLKYNYCDVCRLFIMMIIILIVGDLFVGGNFESRVWDGSGFADVHDVAYFKGS